MITIQKTEIPTDSPVEKYLPADYTDAYNCDVTTAKSFTADDVMVGFWAGQTGWVSALFRLRHFLVRFVGLQGSEGHAPASFEKMIREGGSYRFASVVAKNDHETVLLLSDKHLDAWMSVYVAGESATRGKAGETDMVNEGCVGSNGARKTIFVITVVRFHNRLGRVYFSVIRPFHALIVKNMLRKAAKKVV